MASNFKGDEKVFDPSVCEYWQLRRVPYSPLHPRTDYLRWLHTDSLENYRQRGNKEFSEESVDYRFNSLGYRGPEFKLELGERGALFIGDSNTLGLGTPWDGLWTSHVVRRLEKHWQVPVRQLNMGWGATGSDYVAMMIHQAAEVLRPAIVCVLWSFIGRTTWFANPRKQVHFIPEWRPDSFTEDHAAYLRLATDSQSFFNFVRNFHLVNDRLSNLGIPYFWGTMEPFSPEMLQPYVPLDGYAGNWKNIDLARDGRHAGLKSHDHFAGLIMTAVEKCERKTAPHTFSEAVSAPQPAPIPLEPPKSTLSQFAAAILPGFISRAIDSIVVKRRIRAMKRKDPFIY
jgi:hypothetical protein